MNNQQDRTLYIIIALFIFLGLSLYWFICNQVIVSFQSETIDLIAIEILFFAPLFLGVQIYSLYKKYKK